MATTAARRRHEETTSPMARHARSSRYAEQLGAPIGPGDGAHAQKAYPDPGRAACRPTGTHQVRAPRSQRQLARRRAESTRNPAAQLRPRPAWPLADALRCCDAGTVVPRLHRWGAIPRLLRLAEGRHRAVALRAATPASASTARSAHRASRIVGPEPSVPSSSVDLRGTWTVMREGPVAGRPLQHAAVHAHSVPAPAAQKGRDLTGFTAITADHENRISLRYLLKTLGHLVVRDTEGVRCAAQRPLFASANVEEYCVVREVGISHHRNDVLPFRRRAHTPSSHWAPHKSEGPCRRSSSAYPAMRCHLGRRPRPMPCGA